MEVCVYGDSTAEVLIAVLKYGVSKTEEFTKIFHECQGSKIFMMSNYSFKLQIPNFIFTIVAEDKTHTA